jgi:hypothetical protein
MLAHRPTPSNRATSQSDDFDLIAEESSKASLVVILATFAALARSAFIARQIVSMHADVDVSLGISPPASTN